MSVPVSAETEQTLLTLPSEPLQQQPEESTTPSLYSKEDRLYFDTLVAGLEQAGIDNNVYCAIGQAIPREPDAVHLVLIREADEKRLAAGVTTHAQMEKWFTEHYGADKTKWVLPSRSDTPTAREAWFLDHYGPDKAKWILPPSEKTRYSVNAFSRKEGIVKFTTTADWRCVRITEEVVIGEDHYLYPKSILQPVIDEKTKRVVFDSKGRIKCKQTPLFKHPSEGIPYTLLQDAQEYIAAFYATQLHYKFLVHLVGQQKYDQALHYLRFLFQHHNYRARATLLTEDAEKRKFLHFVAETLPESAEKTAFLQQAVLLTLNETAKYSIFHDNLFKKPSKNGNMLLQYLVRSDVLPAFLKTNTKNLVRGIIAYLRNEEVPSLFVDCGIISSDLLLATSGSSCEFSPMSRRRITEPEALPEVGSGTVIDSVINKLNINSELANGEDSDTASLGASSTEGSDKITNAPTKVGQEIQLSKPEPARSVSKVISYYMKALWGDKPRAAPQTAHGDKADALTIRKRM